MAKSQFEIPWQSFVDCLSTVLVVVIFFAIVLILLVSILSYTISQRQQQKAHTEGGLVERALDQRTPDSSRIRVTSPREEFIILYDGLNAEPTDELLKEFCEWVKRRDPSGSRPMRMEQTMTLQSASFTDRRSITFKRYYFLAKTIKHELDNKHVIRVLTIIQGDKEVNKMVISFAD